MHQKRNFNSIKRLIIREFQKKKIKLPDDEKRDKIINKLAVGVALDETDNDAIEENNKSDTVLVDIEDIEENLNKNLKRQKFVKSFFNYFADKEGIKTFGTSEFDTVNKEYSTMSKETWKRGPEFRELEIQERNRRTYIQEK